jgi:hypothetical protein
MERAERFCRGRTYLSTCSLHGITAAEAIDMAVSGELPPFLKELEDSDGSRNDYAAAA